MELGILKIKMHNAKFCCIYCDFDNEDWSIVAEHLKKMHHENSFSIHTKEKKGG